MSSRDLEFIESLSFSSSDIARILNISRQSVSRGVRSDADYLDRKKVLKISEEAKLNGFKKRTIETLIDKFYPHYRGDLAQIALAEIIKLSIDSDMYFSCSKLAYYMSIYKQHFIELANYIKGGTNKNLYFAFPDQYALRFNKGKIKAWLGDETAENRCYSLICPSMMVFPFSVSGMSGSSPVVYFCEDKGFARQNRNNSRWIVKFVQKYIADHPQLVSPMFNQQKIARSSLGLDDG